MSHVASTGFLPVVDSLTMAHVLSMRLRWVTMTIRQRITLSLRKPGKRCSSRNRSHHETCETWRYHRCHHRTAVGKDLSHLTAGEAAMGSALSRGQAETDRGNWTA